jgi:iron complex outermembrane receptor protein
MDNTGDFTNWGVFADGTYDLTDTVRVSAGLRYSYDEKDYSWQTFPSDVDWPYAPLRIAYIPAETGTPEEQWLDKFEDDDDWDKVTGRLVFDWQFTDTAMTYLSYATGYKSGQP